jgi:hypothetical protein
MSNLLHKIPLKQLKYKECGFVENKTNIDG